MYKWFRYNIFIWLFLATESFLSSHKTETVKRTTQGCRLPVMKKKKKYSYLIGGILQCLLRTKKKFYYSVLHLDFRMAVLFMSFKRFSGAYHMWAFRTLVWKWVGKMFWLNMPLQIGFLTHGLVADPTKVWSVFRG